MLALGLFNLKKRLVALPLGTTRAWMVAHGVLGAISIPLYLQHTGGLWPGGFYERAIALCFYTVMLSGIVGYGLQRLLPRRLAHLDHEVIYERIPSEVFALRERVEALVMKGVQDAASDTLGRYYLESLHWFFRQPRFFLNHLMGSGRSLRWIGGHVTALRRYLNEAERAVLGEIEQLALRKNQLDAHYALQSVLKLWLFVHVPAAVLLLGLAFWHLLVVNIYVL
jgi:alkylhydroperoxidase family enzyme